MKAILTGVLCVGMASVAFARDRGFSLPVPPGIPHQLVPGAKGSWLPAPPVPPLASWDHVRAPGIGRVPVLVPDFDGHRHHGHGFVGLSVPPLIVPRVVVSEPVVVPAPVVCAPPVVYAPAPPVVYAPAPVVYAPAPVVVAAPVCAPRYYLRTSVGSYYSNGGISIGFSYSR